MKGEGSELRCASGIGAILWLLASIDATLRLAWKMADSDALELSIILISTVWLQNSNPALQYATTRYKVGPLYTALIVTTARVLPPVVAAITHRGGSLVMMNPVGRMPGRIGNMALLTDSEWAVVLSYSECFRSDMYGRGVCMYI
ncbi:hypothetical protein B0H13DRAFT_1895157 [Mycena leptocephala]|nr:hypothetical protein B0H13DRAFT_1895157 [Mycena leptocephala]